MRNREALFHRIVIAATVLASTGTSTAMNVDGEALFRQARRMERAAFYGKAAALYQEAKRCFQAKQDVVRAALCRTRTWEIEKILLCYPHNETVAVKLINERFRLVPEARRKSWLNDGRLECVMIDGQPRYFEEVDVSLLYRNLDLWRRDGHMVARYRAGYEKTRTIMGRSAPAEPWQPHFNPHAYVGKSTLHIPRGKLPRKGVFRLWVPLPILTRAQSHVRIRSISPADCVPYPYAIGGDLGLAYLEFPLGKLTGDLKASVEFEFTHYQREYRVDPATVGEYDRDSALYRKYTASGTSVAVTPAIRAKSREIVGSEPNPYLSARKIFDYVVGHVYYSHVPHVTLPVLGMPESVYVHENGYGDCGAQSAYFAALCRAVGIPARAIGGYQMLIGQQGTHFWAEFYLPRHGWLPVDTSVAQIARYLPDLNDEDRRRYRDFYFGGMDPFRMVIQKDLDVPLVPTPSEPVLMPIAMQFPQAVCSTMDDLPGLLVLQHWKFEILPAGGGG